MRQLFAIIMLVFCSSCINQRVDLIVHHAQIYTVNNDFATAEAMAIQDGKIIAVGTNDAILKEIILSFKYTIKVPNLENNLATW